MHLAVIGTKIVRNQAAKMGITAGWREGGYVQVGLFSPCSIIKLARKYFVKEETTILFYKNCNLKFVFACR